MANDDKDEIATTQVYTDPVKGWTLLGLNIGDSQMTCVALVDGQGRKVAQLNIARDAGSERPGWCSVDVIVDQNRQTARAITFSRGQRQELQPDEPTSVFCIDIADRPEPLFTRDAVDDALRGQHPWTDKLCGQLMVGDLTAGTVTVTVPTFIKDLSPHDVTALVDQMQTHLTQVAGFRVHRSGNNQVVVRGYR